MSGNIERQPGSDPVILSGSWTTPYLADIESKFISLADTEAGAELQLDASAITAMDTGGAWLLHRLLTRLAEQGVTAHPVGLRREYSELLSLVKARLKKPETKEESCRKPGLLEWLGRRTWAYLDEGAALLAFLGETCIALLRTLKRPSRIRWSALFSNLQHAGAEAIPIISLLSFLLGIVIAYQGGIQLQIYGANIFIVEIVSLTMIRELAPMMTAIIVAGRTGSAYTAEIGMMQVTEEVDALRTLGISPMDMLVLPKLFGLIVVLPLLTVVADAMGIFGGMVMATRLLDISFQDFLDRIPQVVPVQGFLVGLSKAPVFAMIVAIVGCFQGFQVSGSAESVGRQTTVSVVHAIFLVIVADAAFSILFSWMGI
jgi:phospholipid/cholesterol/gamma-HCH transport system permease protein